MFQGEYLRHSWLVREQERCDASLLLPVAAGRIGAPRSGRANIPCLLLEHRRGVGAELRYFEALEATNGLQIQRLAAFVDAPYELFHVAATTPVSKPNLLDCRTSVGL